MIQRVRYRRLGRSGLYVSEFSLGTVTFGMPIWGCDEDTAARIVHRYLNAGGTSPGPRTVTVLPKRSAAELLKATAKPWCSRRIQHACRGRSTSSGLLEEPCGRGEVLERRRRPVSSVNRARRTLGHRIASNEPFSSWTKTFADPRLCAAIVDRLTFAGQIIETGSTSYRLAHARNARPAS